MQVNVSSSIEREDYERWKKTGMKLNHVIKLGLMNAEQTPGFIKRITELEQDNLKLQGRVRELALALHGGV